MSTLIHLCRKIGSIDVAQLNELLSMPDTAILVAQEGVYNLLNAHSLDIAYALEDDINARNIPLQDDAIRPLSYPQFVELCVQFDKVIKW